LGLRATRAAKGVFPEQVLHLRAAHLEYARAGYEQYVAGGRQDVLRVAEGFPQEAFGAVAGHGVADSF
jgi:hypothetical protein